MPTGIERIIVPLDVSTEAEAIALIDALPQVTFWKVGLELFVSSGPAILSALKQRQKRIFLDLKFHDIPNTVAGACRSAARYNVDLLTIHGTCGRAALKAAQAALQISAEEVAEEVAKEVAGEVGEDSEAAEDTRPTRKIPQLIAITLLTSLNSRDLAFDLNVSIELPEYALNMALLARDCGLAGAVCSPQEAAQIRDVCGKDFVLVCPGVRPKWSEKGDQKRSLTPRQAIKAGANYLVIGRPITASPDPTAALLRIAEELES